MGIKTKLREVARTGDITLERQRIQSKRSFTPATEKHS